MALSGLLVLETLDVMGLMHCYGIAQQVQQISRDILQLDHLHDSTTRCSAFEQHGCGSRSDSGISDYKRLARFSAS